MNTTRMPVGRAGAWVAALVLSLCGGRVAAFAPGSNGSHGAMNITANTTLEVPPDGVFHCTTISVAGGVTLRFARNPLNTPVFLLATGDVNISGIIDIAGAAASGAIPGVGGPGGFDGGFGGFGDSAPANRGGDGNGPGRGVNASQLNNAAHANAAGANTNVYGNVLILPMIGGSGGAGSNGNPGTGGGGGGGALLIASATRITVNGQIRAMGGFSGAGGSGSGGAVRLVAPTGGGNGIIDVQGGSGASPGRIRIDCTAWDAFRNLRLFGHSTRGTRMFVFPVNPPSLHIVEAAGQTIAVGAPSGVTVELPAGSPTTQTVRLRGQGFSGNVPVTLVVNPEHTSSTTYNLVLNGSATPPEVSTTVTLPIGEPTRIEAWVR